MSRDLHRKATGDLPVRMTLQMRVVLGRFAQRPGIPLANRDIAQALDLGTGTVTEIMKRLVHAKLAEQRPHDQHDRHLLTDAGAELAAAHGLVLVPASRAVRMQHEPGS